MVRGIVILMGMAAAATLMTLGVMNMRNGSRRPGRRA